MWSSGEGGYIYNWFPGRIWRVYMVMIYTRQVVLLDRVAKYWLVCVLRNRWSWWDSMDVCVEDSERNIMSCRLRSNIFVGKVTSVVGIYYREIMI